MSTGILLTLTMFCCYIGLWANTSLRLHLWVANSFFKKLWRASEIPQSTLSDILNQRYWSLLCRQWKTIKLVKYRCHILTSHFLLPMSASLCSVGGSPSTLSGCTQAPSGSLNSALEIKFSCLIWLITHNMEPNICISLKFSLYIICLMHKLLVFSFFADGGFLLLL